MGKGEGLEVMLLTGISPVRFNKQTHKQYIVKPCFSLLLHPLSQSFTVKDLPRLENTELSRVIRGE